LRGEVFGDECLSKLRKGERETNGKEDPFGNSLRRGKRKRDIPDEKRARRLAPAC